MSDGATPDRPYDGFRVEIDAARARGDIVLDRPPYNVITMPQRDQLRLAFEALDEDARVRVIVLRSVGKHFSSGGYIKGFSAGLSAFWGSRRLSGCPEDVL